MKKRNCRSHQKEIYEKKQNKGEEYKNISKKLGRKFMRFRTWYETIKALPVPANFISFTLSTIY